MRKIIVSLFTIAFYGISLLAQEKTGNILKISLEDCVGIALQNNYNRQSVALNELSSKEVYEQSKKERLPNLNASLGETFTNNSGSGSDWSGNYSLNSGITLYQGGSIKNSIEKNKMSADQSKLLTTQYDNDLILQVLQAFLTALGNEELLRYQEAVLKASSEQVNQGKLRLKAGEIIESDFLLLEAQYAKDKNSILESTINRNNGLNTLKKLMALDLEQNIEIIYPDSSSISKLSLMPTENEVLEQSKTAMPDLRISDFNIKIAESNVLISQSGYAPTLSLKASIGSGHNSDFSDYGSQLSDRLNEQVGLTISIPLFDRGATKSKVSQNKIALQKAKLDREQTELDLKHSVIQDYRSVVLAESAYQSSEIRRNAYMASFETYRIKFIQGTITTVDLLQQQNNYISAMNDYIQNKYAYILKRKVLDVYMGEAIKM